MKRLFDDIWVAFPTIGCLGRVSRYHHDIVGLRADQDELQKRLFRIQTELKNAKEVAQKKIDSLQKELHSSKVTCVPLDVLFGGSSTPRTVCIAVDSM